MTGARGRLYLFLAGFVALLALAGFDVRHGGVVDTNLLSLLPHGERPPAVEAAVKLIAMRSERAHVALVSAPDAAAARKAADLAAQSLTATGLYARIAAKVDTDRYVRLGRYYFPYRYRLLTDALATQIRSVPDALLSATLRRLYSPVGGGANLEQDPFFTLEKYLATLAGGPHGALELEGGYLAACTADGRYHVLVTGELAVSPFDVAAQEQLAVAKAQLADALGPMGATVRYAGVVEHAAAGTRTGQAEMTMVGGLSLAGVLLILIFVFKSARPVLASFATIFLGIIGGFAACVVAFGQIHLITLVAGTSLIGISIDYALHYFVAWSDRSGEETPEQALGHILPGISLGLVTSLAAFAALLLAPFPGLQQLAVFSGAGLVAAFLSVICLYPLVAGRGGAPLPASLMRLSAGWLSAWHPARRTRHALLVVAFGACGYAAAFSVLKGEDDVRLLQTPDKAVVVDEAAVKSITGQNIAPQFYLVTGVSPEAVLQSEERLVARLATPHYRSAAAGYVALSRYVPSEEKQKQSLATAARLMEGTPSVIARLGDQIGFAGDLPAQFARDLAAEADTPLTLTSWLDADLMPEVARLWLGPLGKGEQAPLYGTVMLVNGVQNLSLLAEAAAADPSVQFVDTVADISAILGRYRHRAQWLLAGAYLAIGLALSFRYGARHSLMVLVPPLAAAGVAVGGLALLGEPYNLFNVVGLILVLGIGIDYTLFFREARHNQAGTGLAILLAAVSTMLAFGLLAFSSMPALHSFGLTILLGIAAALLFAPLSVADQNREEDPAR